MPHLEVDDSVSVSASYYFSDRRVVPEPVTRAAHRIFDRPDGSVVLAFGRSEVESGDAEVRQSEFLKVESNIFSRIRALQISREQLSNFGGELHLRLTLSPASGQAGIVLTQDVLERWAGLGADLYVDAFPD